MVVSQKEDIPITLLSMKGKYSLTLLRPFSSFVFFYIQNSRLQNKLPLPPFFLHHLVVSAECLKRLLTLA